MVWMQARTRGMGQRRSLRSQSASVPAARPITADACTVTITSDFPHRSMRLCASSLALQHPVSCEDQRLLRLRHRCQWMHCMGHSTTRQAYRPGQGGQRAHVGKVGEAQVREVGRDPEGE